MNHLESIVMSHSQMPIDKFDTPNGSDAEDSDDYASCVGKSMATVKSKKY
jgi:hypothetical protein